MNGINYYHYLFLKEKITQLLLWHKVFFLNPELVALVLLNDSPLCSGVRFHSFVEKIYKFGSL